MVLVALIALGLGVAVPASTALAGTSVVRTSSIPCNESQTHTVGSLVTITAVGTPCGTAATPGGNCALTYKTALKSQGVPLHTSIIGSAIRQFLPIGSTSTAFGRIVWTYALQAPGQAPALVHITVTAGKGVGVTGASVEIQDTKNISDGAAKGQASD